MNVPKQLVINNNIGTTMENSNTVSDAVSITDESTIHHCAETVTHAAIKKYHISADTLLKQSYQLGQLVIESGFKPTFIVGIWRGGAPVGIGVQEFLKFFNIKSDHISIRTSSYTGIGQQSSEIRVHGLEYMAEHANVGDSLLLVDDIFDSGRSIDAVIKALKGKMRLNLPHDIRIATVFYKPKNNKTSIIPDYFVEQTDRWVVFPHELEDMTIDEIIEAKGSEIGEIVKNTQKHMNEKVHK